VTFPAGRDSATGDGDLVSCRVGPDGAILGLFLVNGAFCASAGDTLAALSPPATFSADFSDPRAASGYILTSAPVTVALPRFAASRVTVDGKPVTFTARGGRTVFTVSGNGAWRAERGLAPPANIRAADLPGDQGHRIRLTWTLSPDDGGGRVTVYRIFRSRSPVLTDPVPLTRFSSLDSLAVWEMRVTVLIDSVSAGVTEYTDPAVPLNGATYYYWLQASGPGGASKLAAAEVPAAVAETPGVFSLWKAYPNPFNASVVIPFSLPREARVSLDVYTITGSRVATLADGRFSAGRHESVWNASGFSSGVYLVVLRAEGRTVGTVKALLVK
jgi:hypothetical protein